tara:strand:+ start:120 stop:254 length:135 start_codon:yes stop_codon:yes gene_type:complete
MSAWRAWLPYCFGLAYMFTSVLEAYGSLVLCGLTRICFIGLWVG